VDFFSDALKLYFAGIHYFFDPTMILLVLLGTIVGILNGSIPGLTSTMGLAVFTPLTFGMNPAKAIVFLIGIYQGSVYGGSISAIIVNIPGTPSAIATGLDGYPMCQRGEAGRAIGFSTVASFLGGLIGIAALTFTAPSLARVALGFSAEEYVALVVLGLSIIAYISPGSLLRGMIAGTLGLVLGTVGQDPMTAYPRFTFNLIGLFSGLELIPALIGFFGVTEVLNQIGKKSAIRVFQEFKNIIPGLGVIARLWALILRSSLIGVFVGATPAAGGSIAAMMAYGVEKRMSKDPEKWGKGTLEGIIAPESANNASVGGAFIPMLTLGIPGDPMTAVLIGALMIHGLKTGPVLFTAHADFVSSIFIGNTLSLIFLLILGLCCARYFAKMINSPSYILMPLILAFCMIGSYAIRNSLFDIYVAVFCGILGYLLNKVKIPVAPLTLGLVLGPMLEENFRRVMILSEGKYTTLFTRPISASILMITVGFLFYPHIRSWFKKKKGGQRM